MGNIIKSVFYALKKDKIFIASIILTFAYAAVNIALAVITNNFYRSIMEELAGSVTDPETAEIILGYSGISFICGQSMYIANVNGSSLFSLILNIFSIILICKEYKGGSIRAKIIAGYSKVKIYFSLLIVYAAFVCLLFSAEALINLLAGTVLFGFQADSSLTPDVAEMIKYFLYGLVYTIFMVSLFVFLAMLSETTGKTILFYLIIVVLVSVIVSILSMYALDEDTAEIMEIVSYMIPDNLPTAVQNNYVTDNAGIIGSASCLLYSAVLSVTGAFLFKAKDIK